MKHLKEIKPPVKSAMPYRKVAQIHLRKHRPKSALQSIWKALWSSEFHTSETTTTTFLRTSKQQMIISTSPPYACVLWPALEGETCATQWGKPRFPWILNDNSASHAALITQTLNKSTSSSFTVPAAWIAAPELNSLLKGSHSWHALGNRCSELSSFVLWASVL